jgi:hypothetical protein
MNKQGVNTVPVLLIGDIVGQTQQGYDGMIAALGDALKRAPGHLVHMSHPTDGGWRVIEVWRSQADADAWFDAHVAPNLPAGVQPQRTFNALHNLLTTELVEIGHALAAAPRATA